MEIQELKRLFEENYGEVPEITKLKGGGSSRKYYRLSKDNLSVIGVYNEDACENDVFLKLDAELAKQKVRVPEIIRVSENRQYFLQEDLGDVLLLDLLYKEDRLKLAKKALLDLFDLQLKAKDGALNHVGFPPFSDRLVKWDLNYFKYCFLKTYGLSFDEEKLEQDFDRLTNRLLHHIIINGFMYRDFQSRNIMVKDGEFYFIDFQGARKGPLAYDAVSFVWQAKAPFTYEEREELMGFYTDLLSKEHNVKTNLIKDQVNDLIVFRTLQVLGAYGFRGLIERKSHFIESLPLALNNLEYLSNKGKLDEYPEIKRLSVAIKTKRNSEVENSSGPLVLKIFSFSYKKGYPEDTSGNGGGFMFDCRGVHNPGRYEEYKNRTGLDTEVINFLENENEACELIKNSFKVVSPSIKKYLDRGFTSLVVGFGCTGGQHRSVYFAEKFAKKVKEKYPDLKIEITHREQGIVKCI